jgi:deoxyxylulose-5-phosphate synthase
MWAINMDIKSDQSKRKFSYQSSTRRYFWFPKKQLTTILLAGHSSTSISAALGMAIASNLKGEFNKHHIAMGDASIASGFEGLNHAGVTDANLL